MMTDLLQRDRQPHSDGGQPADSSAADKQPSGSQVASAVSVFLLRCSYFIGGTILVIVLGSAVVEVVSWAIWCVHPFTRQAELENQIGSPVYTGASWAQEFWQEESARRKKPAVYVPFRLWSVTNWHGKYINNDQGVKGVWRRTINPAKCDAAHKTAVWTFGGSTMYGTAVPDWATIPSYLSRELNAVSGACVLVSNFGVEGYVTDQELILLGEQLKAGGHPDIVIFYDGVNDSSLAWPPSSSPNAHFSFGTIKTRVEGSISGRLDFLQKSYAARLAREALARLHPVASFASLVSKSQPNVLATVDNYEANMRLAHALSESYKFKLYCFWQPMLVYGHKPFVPFEQQMATRDASGTTADSAWFLTNAAAYREAEHRAAVNGNFVFLGGLFDSTIEPVYVDEAHLGPRGNEIAAEAIASYIKEHPEH
jgi:lysophospholipase L1-like esterase